MQGIVHALRIQWAAGATLLLSPHNKCHIYRREEHRSDADFEAYLARVAAAGLKPHAQGLFSAHQMSSCRMADRAQDGCVGPDGRTFEVRNLFVADAAVMPSACGVNPMISIMTFAHGIAAGIAAQSK
jgi:choline dehydrogenase-like flavoprotein